MAGLGLLLWSLIAVMGAGRNHRRLDIHRILPGIMLLGAGAGLAMPTATESVMGSLPRGDTGVGSAANGAFLQTGGALGVAVIGSLLNTRYVGDMSSTAFVSGMDLGLPTGACAAVGGCVIALAILPKGHPSREG